MTAATPHPPTCRCGGTGLVDGPEITSAQDRSDQPRRYRQLTACPGHPRRTPPPSLTRATELATAGLAAAREALGQ